VWVCAFTLWYYYSLVRFDICPHLANVSGKCVKFAEPKDKESGRARTRGKCLASAAAGWNLEMPSVSSSGSKKQNACTRWRATSDK
jgi:hypothetical protein